MNELFDKLIIRIFFTIFICLLIVAYKYIHAFFYPSSRQQIFRRFSPRKNSTDTLHLFSRIIGVGLIFSQFSFDISAGLSEAFLTFALEACLGFVLYLSSLYIIESIVLYNFEYSDEILKRKNYAYALICFAQSVAIGYLVRAVLMAGHGSLVMILFLWLIALVLLGFASKTFPIISKLSFNRLLVQKNIGIALSYTGFLWGWTLIISSALSHPYNSIYWYAIQIVLTILLSLIIFPLFKIGLVYAFNLQDDSGKDQINISKEKPQEAIGHGIYEGGLFLTSCLLTMVITGHIEFGTFYPMF